MEMDIKDALKKGFKEWLFFFNIIENVEEVGRILDFVEQYSPQELETRAREVKEAVQHQAGFTWKEGGEWGVLAMATGSGKSKVAIDVAKDICPNYTNDIIRTKICLIVPTEKLRDENWEAEFIKWEARHIYYYCLDRYCYASISDIKDKEYDLVIADEGHNITTNNGVFFKNNKIKRLMVLSATPPSDPDKIRFMKNELHLKLDYRLTTEQAIRLRMVANYEMKVVECTLDSSTKNIPGGTKAKPFLTTERNAYNYQTALINKTFGMGPRGQKLQMVRRLARRNLLKNLPSMTGNVKFILNNFISQDEKVLIFAGSIAQANEVSQYSFHSKSSDKYYHYFKEGKIDELACVAALNEGENLNDVTTIIMVVPDSDDKTFIQQIGRSIRFKIGHTARIIVMIVVDTASEEWFEKASVDFDKSKMTRIRMANLESGNIKTL